MWPWALQQYWFTFFHPPPKFWDFSSKSQLIFWQDLRLDLTSWKLPTFPFCVQGCIITGALGKLRPPPWRRGICLEKLSLLRLSEASWAQLSTANRYKADLHADQNVGRNKKETKRPAALTEKHHRRRRAFSLYAALHAAVSKRQRTFSRSWIYLSNPV